MFGNLQIRKDFKALICGCVIWFSFNMHEMRLTLLKKLYRTKKIYLAKKFYILFIYKKTKRKQAHIFMHVIKYIVYIWCITKLSLPPAFSCPTSNNSQYGFVAFFSTYCFTRFSFHSLICLSNSFKGFHQSISIPTI